VTGVTATGCSSQWIGDAFGPDATVAWLSGARNTNYGQIAGLTNIPGGSRTVRISGVLSGLDASLTYHYHIAVSNSFGMRMAPTTHSERVSSPMPKRADDHPIAYWRSTSLMAHRWPTTSLAAITALQEHQPCLPGYNQFDEDTAAGFGPGINSFVETSRASTSQKGAPMGPFTLECWVKQGS